MSAVIPIAIMRTGLRIPAALAVALGILLGGSLLTAQNPEEVKVTLGRSIVLDYPEDITRISTSNPDIVDYVPVSTREILLHAKGLGTGTVVVWAKSGQRTFYNVQVELNLDPLRKLIRDTFPNEQILVASARESVALTGLVSSQGVADRALALLSPLTKTIVNNLRVRSAPTEKQIVLKVRFAEINRQALQSFGANILSTGAFNTPGRVTTGQFPSGSVSDLRGGIPGGVQGTSTEFKLSDLLNIFAFRPDLNVTAMIRALQQKGLLQILAEPNLVTSNGKEASFLVGGEFPVPILQGGSNSGAVTVQFREFGIRLTFNPTLTDNGTLKMYVKPEVSTIDINNSVTVGGFRIPALSTRRIESNVELSPGQSFVIGGLIDDRTTESLSRIPGLASIPVLGVLFRSREINKTKTELLVMVTPELIDPISPNDPKLTIGMPEGALDPSLYTGPNPYAATAAGPKSRTPPSAKENKTAGNGGRKK